MVTHTSMSRLSSLKNRLPGVAMRIHLLVVLIAGALVLAACGGDNGDPTDATQGPVAAAADGTTDQDDAEAAGPAEPSDTSESGSAVAEGSAGDGEGEPATGAKFASVTLNGQTYITDLSQGFTLCLSMGGALGGDGPVEGVEKSKLSIDLPPEGWETSGDGWSPPSVQLDLGEDGDGIPIDWRAGGEIVLTMADLAGKSQVDSYRTEGLTASGTATFIDFFQVQMGQLDELQPVVGTFEISCG